VGVRRSKGDSRELCGMAGGEKKKTRENAEWEEGKTGEGRELSCGMRGKQGSRGEGRCRLGSVES
jgi:hypothetical protein